MLLVTTYLPGVSGLPRKRNRVRALGFVWTATSIKDIDPIFIGPSTIKKYLHTWDFDLVQNHGAPTSGNPKTIVYIDGLGPLHPDIKTLNLDVDVPDEKLYFGPKRLFLPG